METSESFLDKLFKLEDDSLLIVDFESVSKKANFVKYSRYFNRVLERYGPDVEIRILVVYTSDVENAMDRLVKKCGSIVVEQAYLSHIDGDKEFKAIKDKIEAGEKLAEEEIIKLVILPLTYRGKEKKVEAIDRIIEVADEVKDEDDRVFILSSLCVSTEKFMTENQSTRIEEMIRMTRVGRRIWEDWNRTVGDVREQKGVEKVARRMLENGTDEAFVMSMTGISQDQVDEMLGRKKKEEVVTA